MLTLINGDGNPRVTAAQDADWYGSLTGEKTCIMPANDKFSATVADANTIAISSGVLITKEGRRVQIDAETIEEIIIPTGTQGSDTYYIIGFHLYIDESGQQVAETFVETMENESDTITETTFREGSTSIYISLYRVKRSGLTLESVTRICPMYELSADEIVYGNTNVGSKLTQINSDLSMNVGEIGFYNNWGGSIGELKERNNIFSFWLQYQTGIGTGFTTSTFAIISDGFRPLAAKRYPCVKLASNGLTANGHGFIVIEPNGNITYYGDTVNFQEYIVASGTFIN